LFAIGQLAEVIFSGIFDWENDWFEFSEGPPEIVNNGPVFLNTGHLVFEAVRKHDKKRKKRRRKRGKGHPDL
jgi:hypothetical protein